MPLKWQNDPSEWRKKRSIGIIRSIARNRRADGLKPRAIMAWRSGSRSASTVISAAGLRETWPPSGRIWVSSSWSSRSRPNRVSFSWPDRDKPVMVMAMIACSRTTPTSIDDSPERRCRAWRSRLRTNLR